MFPPGVGCCPPPVSPGDGPGLGYSRSARMTVQSVARVLVCAAAAVVLRPRFIHARRSQFRIGITSARSSAGHVANLFAIHAIATGGFHVPCRNTGTHAPGI
eukprot:scaffold65435_cov44-Attheya_sp.AAC.4